MKTLKLISLVFVSLLVFTSCKKSEGEYPQWQAFATIRTMNGAGAGAYYFQLENGKTLFPAENHISGYPAKEGQRAAIYYNYMEQKKEGYDYTISLYAITEILTKDIKVVKTKAELDALGNDGINVSSSDMSIGNEYLTLSYYVPIINYSEIHEFNLVDNQIPSTNNPSTTEASADYTDLLLCHNSSGSTQEYSKLSYISFKLNDLHPRITGKKGLRIHVKKLNGELDTYQVTYTAGAEDLSLE